MPAVKSRALSAAMVKNVAQPGTYSDGLGLTLRVAPTGGKRWVLRATIDGKQRNIGLGGYPGVSLSEARQAAQDTQQAIRDGADPVAEREEAKAAARAKVAIPTFREVAEQVIALRRPTWSSERHARQWTESLTLHAYPRIGAKRVDTITTSDILDALEPLWLAKPETGSRVKQRVKVVFDYALARGWASSNPSNGALDAALTRRPRLQAHHPALPHRDVPAAVAAIRESNARPATRLGFEFLILTAARAGEVVGAAWGEIDLDNRTWTVPASRMKARREHRVPLSDRAVELLEEARRRFGGVGLLFPSNRRQGALSNESFRMTLNRLGVDAVPHGFRSSFRDWLGERTSASWAVAESCLAHASAERASLGYARTDYLEQRRELMQGWARFCAGSA